MTKSSIFWNTNAENTQIQKIWEINAFGELNRIGSPFYFTKLRRRNCRRKSETVKEILMQTYTIVLPVLLSYIVWLLKNQKKDRDANSKGTMLLLRTQLIEYHAKYMKLGGIPSYAYQNFCEMYEAYHALGGNGMATKMKQEIEELHIKRKGE